MIVTFYKDEYTYEYFKPRPWKLFIENYQEINLKKRIRFLMSCLLGDYMFYMKDKDKKIIGYCLLEPRGWRYPFIDKNDVVISPYVIKPEYRKKGFGTKLLKDITNYVEDATKARIFAIVRINNTASLIAMKKAGYKVWGNVKISGMFRKYIKSDKNSVFVVYVSR